MSTLDIIYLLMLIISIPFGYGLKQIPSVNLKKWLCLAGGMCIVFSLVGLSAIHHSLVVVLFNHATVKLISSRYCHLVSFCFVFGYLFFFRNCVYFGFAAPPKHSNAVQLLVTLRMVSLAFEKHEETEKSCNKREMYIVKHCPLSFLDTLAYGYCYIGLMTGPFYTYQTFQDMLHQDGRKIKTLQPALSNLKLLPLLALPYLCLKQWFPVEYLDSEEFLKNEHGFFYSAIVITLTVAWFRWRFYIGWMLAESGCIAASLGAYRVDSKPKPGQGPTVCIQNPSHEHETEWNFETIQNIVVPEVEFAGTMREFIKSWNKTVQWWLSKHAGQLYSGKSKLFRTCTIYMVSAYWHGTHPGYYLTSFLVALYAYLEGGLLVSAKKRWSQQQGTEGCFSSKLLSWLLFFCAWRFQDFVVVPFMLLKYDVTMRVWAKIYFYGLFILLFLFIAPMMFFTNNDKLSQKSQEETSKENLNFKSKAE